MAAPRGGVGYTGGVGGGVVALDLGTGEEKWRTPVSARPVVAVDESVFALQFPEGGGHKINVVELGAADGSLVRTTGSVELPEWVRVSAVPDERFDYRVKAKEGGGGVVVEWEAHSYYEGGAPPPQYVLDEYEKHAAGAFVVDGRDGSVRELKEADEPAAVPSDASQGDFPVSYRLDGSAAWRTGPWEVGEGLAVLFGEIEEDRQTIYLQVWKKGAPASKPSKLVTGTALLSYVTPDGQYVLIHSESGGKSPWWVFSAESGERVAEVEYEPGAREAAVTESRLYCLIESPTGAVRRCAFKALDLNAGRTLWERTLSERPVQSPPPLRQ